jgi:2,3-bisphosphoglycerate-independent phosphoglycerate mutase
MRYVVMLGDGMADYAVPELGGKTPLEAAYKPSMDFLSQNGELGLVSTLYPDMPTGSDIANLSVLGYDPKLYYTGRSPIEALGIGIPLKDNDTVFRCNLVSLSGEPVFDDNIMLDHSSDKIPNEEAFKLLDAVEHELGRDGRGFFRGVSYRHIMVWENIKYDYTMIPPHDILGRRIGDYLPDGGGYPGEVLKLMKRSFEILSGHPVNLERKKRGLKPANCIWLWGEGVKPKLKHFYDKYKLNGSVITAVPLIKGLAAGLGLKSIEVTGATGDFHTNYAGKAAAAIDALDGGERFIFIHVEAPDECGHDGDAALKVKSIEKIDNEILAPVMDKLESLNEDYRILLMPDHATPLEKRTHTPDPVPYAIYEKNGKTKSRLSYNEKNDADTKVYMPRGHELMARFING